MIRNVLSYKGNGAYCYANSASMLLSSASIEIPPAMLEVLSGVGLGAFLSDDGMFMLSNLEATPETGISKSLEILGISCFTPQDGNMASDPIQQMRDMLKESPVMVGPLDMGYLENNPAHIYARGFDHFVLAYDIGEKEILFHDPDGFPCASLSLDAFYNAWKSEGIKWPHTPFNFWTCPERNSNPSQEEIHKKALSYFRSIYSSSEDASRHLGWKINGEAIDTVVRDLSDGKITKKGLGRMENFIFEVGSRRALDYADFFSRNGDYELSEIKSKQASILGKCHSLAVKGDWKMVCGRLQELSHLEEDFKSSLMK